MITKKTLWKDFLDSYVKANEGCQEAVDWAEGIDKTGFTTAEGLTKLVEELDKPDGWAIWCLKMFGDQCDPEVREIFLSKIKNEMMAFRLYIDQQDLTEEEDIILQAKFKDKLRRAEKQLKEGVVSRKKTIVVAEL